MRYVFQAAFVSILWIVPTALADDWPQWLGPQRDGVWHETGIVQEFPSDGLHVKWRVPIGLGYAGPAVVGDKLFVMDYQQVDGEVENAPDHIVDFEGVERVLCLNVESGEVEWEYQYPRDYHLSYPSGPRCTPTVVDGRVYALGAQGDLTCLDADSGKVIWSRSLTDDYKTKSPVWGFAAHPLVDGQSLYCIVGGPGSVAVAFDKDSGKELWSALSAASQGYCPPMMIRHGGRKQLLIWHPESLNSLDPKSGQVYWSMELQPGYQMSIAAPRLEGDYLYASGIGNIGALYELDQEKPAASVVWRGTPKNAVYASNTTPIIDSGVIYGVDCSSGALTAARIEDGRRLWETMQPTTGGQRRASHGTAFIVKHKNGYFLFSETGDLILANLSPQGYREISRFHVLDPTNECFGRPVVWSHPAFANRCAYVRNDEEIVCVSLATR